MDEVQAQAPVEGPTSKSQYVKSKTKISDMAVVGKTRIINDVAPVVKTRSQMFLTHLQRCFGWRLNLVKPTSYESDFYDKGGIESSTLRSYISWRKSQMLCSIPVLMSAAFTGLADVIISDEHTDGGNFIRNLPNIANFILLIAVFAAIGIPTEKFRVWPKWRLSSKIIRVGFIISSILPLIPAIIPWRALLTDDNQDKANDAGNAAAGGDTARAAAAIGGDAATSELIKHFLDSAGIQNFVAALPVILSFPSGILKGSLRIRGLLPDSHLSSWVLTTTAPCVSIAMLAASILVIQILGDLILMFGVLFLCLSPWMYVFRRGLYVKASTEEGEKKVDRNQMLMLVMNLLGLVLCVIWACLPKERASGKEFQRLLSDQEATAFAQFILEVWGRGLATTVVFTDILLRMTISNWRVEKGSRNMDDLYEGIEKCIRKNKSGEGDDAGMNLPYGSSDNLDGVSESIERLDQNDIDSSPGADIDSGMCTPLLQSE